MKALMDHFLVIKTQQDIDLEFTRLKIESDNIEKNRVAKRKVVNPDKSSKTTEGEEKFEISNFINSEVLTVASVGKDCEEVKVGDQVIVRANTRPEVTIYNGVSYWSYPERSISVVLEDEDKM